MYIHTNILLHPPPPALSFSFKNLTSFVSYSPLLSVSASVSESEIKRTSNKKSIVFSISIQQLISKLLIGGPPDGGARIGSITPGSEVTFMYPIPPVVKKKLLFLIKKKPIRCLTILQAILKFHIKCPTMYFGGMNVNSDPA